MRKVSTREKVVARQGPTVAAAAPSGFLAHQNTTGKAAKPFPAKKGHVRNLTFEVNCPCLEQKRRYIEKKTPGRCRKHITALLRQLKNNHMGIRPPKSGEKVLLRLWDWGKGLFFFLGGP